ncbi:MAG: hypothetical protein ACTSSB_14045 [Candidatus Heimdallarchaeota archaeon]
MSIDDTSIYTGEEKRAFIVKITGTIEKMLNEDEIMIGWSKAEGLIQVAGDLWRFIRDMGRDHFILVKSDGGFYIGRVAGPATYDEMKIFNDTSFRRKIEWLNKKEPFPLERTPDDLVKRMKSVQSVIEATDLYDEISFIVRMA